MEIQTYKERYTTHFSTDRVTYIQTDYRNAEGKKDNCEIQIQRTNRLTRDRHRDLKIDIQKDIQTNILTDIRQTY